MGVNIYHITAHQGMSFDFKLSIEDENGDAESLVGYTAYLQVRDKPGGKLYVDLSSASGGDITALDATGIILIHTDASVTALWMFRHGVYDLCIKYSTGEPVTYLLKGNFDVEPRVTV